LKLKLFIFLLPILILSCESKESSTLIYSQKTKNYEISLSTINTKINEAGVAQCSNYARTKISDSIFHSYGLSLKEVIAFVSGTIPKYVEELPSDSLKNKFLDVKIKNTNESHLTYDTILSSAVMNVFQLKINRVDSLVNGYLLIVKDSVKLKSQQTECKTGTLGLKNGKLVISKCRLSPIVKELDQHTDEYIESGVFSEHCYSFDFVVGNNISEINASLAPLGLVLRKASFRKTFFDIQLAKRKEEVHDFQPPLDIVDGAARVMDPLFDGINTGKHWCGKFLKDYKPISW
jgi:hypothetical protein